MCLHLKLEHVVLLDLVATEIGQGWILDDHSRRHVLQDVVIGDQSCRILLSQDTARVVINDQIAFEQPLGIDQYDTVEVVVDCVLFDDELVFTLNDKEALTLAVFDLVVPDLGLTGVLAADRDVCLDIGIDLVRYDLGVASLDDEDALVVVVPDHIRVRKTLEAERAIDIIFKVLHCHLVTEVLVVQLGRFLMNRLESGEGLDAHLLGSGRTGRHDAAWPGREACSARERYTLSWLTLRSQMVHVARPMRASDLLRRQHLARSRLLLLEPQKVILLRNGLRKCHDVFFASSADVSDGVLHDLDATLTVVCDDVAPDVRFAVLTEHDDAVEGALFDLVAPDQRHRPRLVVVADDLHAVLVGF